MQGVATNGKPYAVGKVIAVFTNNPEPIGSEFNVVDRDGNVLNIARVTHVQLSSAINVKLGKYVVQGQVIQEMSMEHDAPFAARVYWT